ncbi:DUF1501 domain-containing protein [Neolewinella persica]|uniref:DUF1501 domain-containing protein n=1 Tax=Neolewinella persica TaxID=70998 RepID=UPI00037AA1A8|nr:DUF1501 domain-containing protein [Neolewinella persica]
MKINANLRRGTSLEDDSAHIADHQQYGRRSFLRTLGLGSAATLAAAGLPATGLYGFPLAAALNENFSDRKLVLIRLKGGNDGLNTIVPLYALDRYRSLRPTVAHAESNLVGLNSDFGIPAAMQPLKGLWDDGRMRVVNSVGYEDHNLSHFTGADIMASGNANPDENGDGWLARYYVNQNPDYRTDLTGDPPAIKIGGPTSVLFNDSDKIDISANFANADRLEDLAQTGVLYDNLNAPDDCYHGEQVLFLRTIANAATLYSTAIAEAYQNSITEAEYTSSLGEQLRLVARLIKGGLKTQFYLVTLDGFDTHVGQNGSANHPGLLNNLSTAVAAFYEDLAAGDKEEEVLAMTYSEFGRRVQENGVSGTDHGTALPVMLFGPALGGSGTHGRNPDLDDLDATGNLRFGTDFRSLYATLLENWLCIDAGTVNEILGGDYARVGELGLACSPTSSTLFPAVATGLQHRVITRSALAYELELTLPRATRLEVEIVAFSGQRLQRLGGRLYPAGTHRLAFTLPQLRGHVAAVGYSIRANGQRYGGKFIAGMR